MKKTILASLLIVAMSSLCLAQSHSEKRSYAKIGAKIAKQQLIEYPTQLFIDEPESVALLKQAAQVMKNNPKSPQAIYNYAILRALPVMDEPIYTEPRHLDKAITLLSKLLQSHPEMVLINRPLADFKTEKMGISSSPFLEFNDHNNKQRRADAQEVLNHYLRILPCKDSAVYHMISTLYYGLGNEEKGNSFSKQALLVEVASCKEKAERLNTPEAYAELFAAYDQANDHKNAKKAFQMKIKLEKAAEKKKQEEIAMKFKKILTAPFSLFKK